MARPAFAILTCSLLLAVAADSQAQPNDGQVAELAVVRSVGDLANQTALVLKNGAKVRVGLETRQAPQHSAVLIYALVDGAAFSPGDLGPVHVTLRRADVKVGGDKLSEVKRLHRVAKGPRLFASTPQTPAGGRAGTPEACGIPPTHAPAHSRPFRPRPLRRPAG